MQQVERSSPRPCTTSSTRIVYDEAVELIEEHHEAGRDVVIVSSSGAEVVEPIGAMLGADHVIATRMVVEDGSYTGEIAFYAYGPTKAEAIASWPSERATTSPPATPTATRRPTAHARDRRASLSGEPRQGAARVATERGWPVLRFTTPVAMRRRMPRVARLSWYGRT